MLAAVRAELFENQQPRVWKHYHASSGGEGCAVRDKRRNISSWGNGGVGIGMSVPSAWQLGGGRGVVTGTRSHLWNGSRRHALFFARRPASKQQTAPSAAAPAGRAFKFRQMKYCLKNSNCVDNAV